MEMRERIVNTPDTLGGRPRVKDTRLAVSFILELMAAGSSIDDIVSAYSQLSRDDVRACLYYAAESLEPPPATEIDRWILDPDKSAKSELYSREPKIFDPEKATSYYKDDGEDPVDIHAFVQTIYESRS